ncbi:MAG: hypothetical protein NC043_06955 [Muribaculaceae bacterium]|nr:hypothetical protein [Muribaculaceae bacterium]
MNPKTKRRLASMPEPMLIIAGLVMACNENDPSLTINAIGLLILAATVGRAYLRDRRSRLTSTGTETPVRP